MTTVFGRTVKGNVVRQKRDSEQWPGEKFIELLDACFKQQGVDSIRWSQYTPYFNDGEPCIFGVHSVTLKLVNGDDEDGDEADGYVDSYGMVEYPNGWRANKVAKPEFSNVYDAFENLSDSMEHFEDFLEESFGDHAKVTATREGFNIEFYEHD